MSCSVNVLFPLCVITSCLYLSWSAQLSSKENAALWIRIKNKAHKSQNFILLLHQKKRIKSSFPDILVKMEPLNLIPEALTLIAAPGRQALNLESLHHCTVSDELQRAGQGGDFCACIQAEEQNDWGTRDREHQRLSKKKGANFLWERLALLPSVKALRWDNSRTAQDIWWAAMKKQENRTSEGSRSIRH